MTKNVLQLNLLGEVSIALKGELITDWQSNTAVALLIYLACEQKPVSRKYLAEFFWEERDPTQSATNLRVVLSLLRKKVGNHLTITRQTVAFNTSLGYELDINNFTQAVDTLAPLLQPDAPPLTPHDVLALEEAANLYRGSFLTGFSLRDNRSFEEWRLLRQEQYQQKATLLLQRLAVHFLTAPFTASAVSYTNKLLAINPLSEQAHRQKMMLLARSGNLTSALAQYQACADVLHEELAVDPAPETTALAERIRRATQSQRHNLPPAPTPFVGRTDELDNLTQQLLQPECRLVTLLGTGGMGKTRLSLAVAERLVPTGHFLNGVRFVPLAEVEQASLLPTAVASALEITLSPEEPPAVGLAQALAEDELLLVLDNVEQLLESEEADATAAFFDHLLSHAPYLTLLVTSRQRLHLREEWLFPLSGLPANTEGTGLFMQTARRVQRQFAPTAEEKTAMIEICELVEGLPLGIELAAGWLGYHSCVTIARELAESVALLRTSLRNVPARHRSITAVFDHSWALLTTHQQQILARLACFRGGFTAVAAQEIAGATPADLRTLSEASLLRYEAENDRYVSHELLRQYAADQLAELGETAAITTAHATYFTAYVAEQQDPESLASRQSLQLELPNIRTAWQMAVQQEAEESLLDMGPVLHRFFSAESRFYEGIELFRQALGQLPRPLSPKLKADLLGRKAQMHIHIGQLGEAKKDLQKAIAALEEINDPMRLSVLLGYMARVTFYEGNVQEAVALTEKCLDLAISIGDQDGEGFAYSFLGSCHKALGNYEMAAANFEKSLKIYTTLDDALGQAMTLNNLGNLAQAQGDFVTAQNHYLTCSRLFLAENHLHGAATTLANAGRLAKKMGDLAGAAALLQESLDLKREQKDGRGAAVALIGLADTAVSAQDFSLAHTYLIEGLTLAEQAGDIKLLLEGQAVQAALALGEGRTAEGQTVVAQLLANPALSQEVREGLEKLID